MYGVRKRFGVYDCLMIVQRQTEKHPLLDFIRVMWHEPNRKVKRVKLYFIPRSRWAFRCSLYDINFKYYAHIRFVHWIGGWRETYRVIERTRLGHFVAVSLCWHEWNNWHSNSLDIPHIGYRLIFFARNLCPVCRFMLLLVCYFYFHHPNAGDAGDARSRHKRGQHF